MSTLTDVKTHAHRLFGTRSGVSKPFRDPCGAGWILSVSIDESADMTFHSLTKAGVLYNAHELLQQLKWSLR